MNALMVIFQKLRDFVRSGNYWKVVGIGFCVAFTGLLFGFAFMLVFEGIFSLLLRLTPYWLPAHKLFGKLSLANSGSLEPPHGWTWLPFIAISIPPLILIAGGAFILGRTGFINQNLFYLLMEK